MHLHGGTAISEILLLLSSAPRSPWSVPRQIGRWGGEITSRKVAQRLGGTAGGGVLLLLSSAGEITFGKMDRDEKLPESWYSCTEALPEVVFCYC